MIKNKTNAVVTNIWFNLFSSDSIRNLILGWKKFRFIRKKIKKLNLTVKYNRVLSKKVLSQRCYWNKLKLNKLTHFFLETFWNELTKFKNLHNIYISIGCFKMNVPLNSFFEFESINIIEINLQKKDNR